MTTPLLCDLRNIYNLCLLSFLCQSNHEYILDKERVSLYFNIFSLSWNPFFFAMTIYNPIYQYKNIVRRSTAEIDGGFISSFRDNVPPSWSLKKKREVTLLPLDIPSPQFFGRSGGHPVSYKPLFWSGRQISRPTNQTKKYILLKKNK